MDVVQLSKGIFKTLLEERKLKNITIKTVKTNLNYETKGLMDKDHFGIFFCSPWDDVLMNNVNFDKKYIAIVPPNKEYYKLTKGNSCQFSITVKKDIFLELFTIYNFQIFEIEKKDFESFYNLIILILNSSKNTSEDIEYSEFMIISYLKLFLNNDNYIKDKNTYIDKFYKIVDYLKKYQLYDISIDELAFKFNVSNRTLRNIFYSSIGISPKKYLKILQLNNLRKHLSQNNLNISQIIINENLPSQSQTGKEFKDLFLNTPLEYKKILISLKK